MRVQLFTSSFCGACTATREVLTQAATWVPSAEIQEFNVAGAPKDAEAADIRSTPTVIISTDDGAEVFRSEGVPTLPQALAAMARAL
jgi:hypothetical protein